MSRAERTSRREYARQLLRSPRYWVFVVGLAVATVAARPLIVGVGGDSAVLYGIVMGLLVLLIGFGLFRTWKDWRG